MLGFRILDVIGLAASLALAAACSTPAGTGSATLHVTTDAVPTVASVRVSVTGSDFAEIDADLTQVGSAWEGTIGAIPAGDDRIFTATAYDAGSNALFAGASMPVTIVAMETASVMLLLQQVTPPPPFNNTAPHIDTIFASSQAVGPGDDVSLSVSASDADGDTLTYAWTGGGTFTAPAAADTDWSASADGAYPITITVTDPYDAIDAVTFSIDVDEANDEGSADVLATFNSWPQVESVIASTGHLQPGVAASVTATATDADGDSLVYAWSTDCGATITGAGDSVAVTVPADSTATSCTITVGVDDGNGGTNTGSLTVAVGADPVVTE